MRIARTLLDHGADVAGSLDLAIYTDNLEMIETLLKAGATLGDDDNLNHAACDGRFDALKLLLESGVRMDGTRGTEHHGGYTPLGCAVSSRSIKGAKWFLENGQDPNRIKSKEGENCLHVAVHYGAGDKMLQLLLEYGARIDQRDSRGARRWRGRGRRGTRRRLPFSRRPVQGHRQNGNSNGQDRPDLPPHPRPVEPSLEPPLLCRPSRRAGRAGRPARSGPLGPVLLQRTALEFHRRSQGRDRGFNQLLDCLSRGNASWAARAPVLMLAVARLLDEEGDPNRHAFYDVGQAVAQMAVQALDLGLYMHQMAGFDVEKAQAGLCHPGPVRAGRGHCPGLPRRPGRPAGALPRGGSPAPHPKSADRLRLRGQMGAGLAAGRP